MSQTSAATTPSTTAKAPGKLMICGEWSVLHHDFPECSCVVVPVNKYLTCTVSTVSHEKKALLDCPDMKFAPIPLTWNRTTSCLEPAPSCSGTLPRSSTLVLSAVRVASYYICAKQPTKGSSLPFVSITVRSDISSSSPTSGLCSSAERNARLCESKPGLGSSSAVIVAVVSCFLRHFGATQTDPLVVYKLSTIAQVLSPDHKNGSAFDIAAAAFHVPIFYRRFDPEWLSSALEASFGDRKAFVNLADGATIWPRLSIDPIPWPRDTCDLLVCFSRKSVSSAALIAKVRSALAAGGDVASRYVEIMREIGTISEGVRDAFLSGHPEGVPPLLRRNRALLCEAQKLVGVEFESPELAAISDTAEEVAKEIGDKVCVGAKFSGSGGGDNAIAVVVSKDPELKQACREKIIARWKSLGFLPLDGVALL